ncbi:hypothetical protein ACFO4O_15720 [Glaciecola siphonariae]|uniref:Uncharacterized protein n=1 Tax=Glaciecola siphonariae TaxID=521012 RepID=A0ABV9M1T4_9ALTE
MGKPDFSTYTIEELMDCKQTIDKERWPERYQEILNAIALRVKDPEKKKSHDELVFIQFCEELKDDLEIAIDDNIWSFLGLFSKQARTSLPSTFEGEICPVCSGSLDIYEKLSFWNLSCYSCDLHYAIQERPNS